jgi:hypothetical protein
MAAAVERDDHLRIRQPVERQRARQADDMPAIDQPPAILARGGVEMHLGGVLPEPGGQHVLGLLDGHAVDMVDHLAHRVVAPAVRLSGQGEIVAGEIQPRGDGQIGRTAAGAVPGITGSGAGAAASRLRTITQRT